MTGQPADQNQSQSQHDQQQLKAWDEQTRALAARLQALLEQDRTQGRDAANDGAREAPGRAPPA